MTTTVEGRTFKNAWNGEIDNATFRAAFAQSCNTAFVSLAPNLGTDGLAKTSKTLGIGAPWTSAQTCSPAQCRPAGPMSTGQRPRSAKARPW